MSLEVHHGNVYVANTRTLKAMRVLLRGKPDAVVVNEGRKVLGLFSRMAGYRAYVSPYGDRRGRTDVIVLVRKNLEHLGSLSLRISKALPKIKVAHERFAVAALFQHPDTGKTAVVGAHPTPGPEALADNDPSNPIVRQYLEAMDTTAALVEYLESEGYAVVLSGDVQIRPGSPGAGRPWSPAAMAKKAGLEVTIWTDLDLMAASKRLRGKGRVLAKKNGGTGSDHVFLAGSYTRNTPKP
jgi:hypothetical protein